jgi:feruloyl esterase
MNNDSCFTKKEIETLKKIFEGTTNPKTGERIYTPIPIGGNHMELSSRHLYLFKWVFGRDFDYTKFDFNKDMEKVDSVLAPILNANNPDLSGMKKKGGKIIMYAGTDDQLVPFQDAVNYYERVIGVQGGIKQTQNFFRFFIVPGMGHCGGGSGLYFGQNFNSNNEDRDQDILSAIIEWVEKDIAPDKLIARTYTEDKDTIKIKFQRPLFPYPKFPHYVGGDPNSLGNYVGIEHQRGGVLIPSFKYLE